MKFHHNTALHFLDRKINLGDFTISDDWQDHPYEYKHRFAMDFIKGWNDNPNKEVFGENIRYITKPFYTAYLNTRKKLKGIFADEPLEESGTIISNLNYGTETIYYWIKTEGVQDNWYYQYMITRFTKMKDWQKPQLQDFASCFLRGEYLEKKAYISNDSKTQGEDEVGTDTFLDIMFMLLFLKYCELETKIISPGKKENHLGEKYLNESAHRIQILNSTWFTTIIRSEGFTVGGETGFFRLQPCGPGLTQKKLVYIAPFQKNGYTRKATISTNPL